MYGTIYCITNLVDGKKFVGRTAEASVDLRWQQHVSASRADLGVRGLLHQAIKEYGPGKFTVEVIDQANSKDELGRLTVHHIAALGTLAPDGFNLFNGSVPSEVMLQKISKASRGQRRSEATRRNMSKAKQRISEEIHKEASALVSALVADEKLLQEVFGAAFRKMDGATFLKANVCRRGHLIEGKNVRINRLSGGVVTCLTCYCIGKKDLAFMRKLYQYAHPVAP